jgi:hypothetical protein
MMSCLMVAVLMVPLSMQAGMFQWFDKKGSEELPEPAPTNAVKRLHLTVTDKAAEKELLQLTGVKRLLIQERQVLMLILDEKKRDLANFDAEFLKSFGIERDRNYRYDPKTMTIFEGTDKDNAGTNKAGVAVEPKPVKKLESEAESRKFASLAAAKQITQEDLVVVARLAKEKETAVGRVEKTLMEKYSMSRDRNYWYDPKAMKLYELVNSSSKGVVQ